MILDRVDPGKTPPDDVNVIIEIPLRGEPVKYELDKATGAMFVDRFLHTSMVYPCNYGYIPQTLSGDGDPVDVLVVTGIPLIVGSVVRSRPVGMLQMTDEHGLDNKVLAVPVDQLSRMFHNIHTPQDLPEEQLNRISHFFQHYKDLEEGKWVKIEGWAGIDAARKEITDGVSNYHADPVDPNP